MKLVEAYLVRVYVIPEKVKEVVKSVRQIVNLNYGSYTGVYWRSSEGVEHFADGNEAAENQTVVVEFSIENDEGLLERVLEQVIQAHPWKEPVIRVMKIQETRVG